MDCGYARSLNRNFHAGMTSMRIPSRSTVSSSSLVTITKRCAEPSRSTNLAVALVVSNSR